MKIHAFFRKMILGLFFLTICNGCSSRPPIPLDQVVGHISKMGIKPTPDVIVVDAKKQTLTILRDSKIHKTFTISTGRRGLGQHAKSFKTPLGLHRINEKIGAGVPKYGIFQRRQYVGTTSKRLPKFQQRKDYISTRILRLEGLESGFNRGKDWFGRLVDSEQRAIYIHGTTFEKALGYPSTKGCVHMSADDVISLFNTIPVGTLVWIN